MDTKRLRGEGGAREKVKRDRRGREKVLKKDKRERFREKEQ